MMYQQLVRMFTYHSILPYLQIKEKWYRELGLH